MPVIDPHGLLRGERLAACTDLAKMLWPRLFVSANGYARLELSYPAILSEIFGNFRKPPTPDELTAVFHEFEQNCLAILYQVEGRGWCQFITPEKYLPRHKTMRDAASPAPSKELVEDHEVAYVLWKHERSLSHSVFEKATISEKTTISEKKISEKTPISEKISEITPISESFRSLPKVSAGSGGGRGGGVGGGGGGGVAHAPLGLGAKEQTHEPLATVATAPTAEPKPPRKTTRPKAQTEGDAEKDARRLRNLENAKKRRAWVKERDELEY